MYSIRSNNELREYMSKLREHRELITRSSLRYFIELIYS